MNICLCCVQSGYPHRETCPFPYFGHDKKKTAEWEKARDELRKRLNPITPEEIIAPAEEMGGFAVDLNRCGYCGSTVLDGYCSASPDGEHHEG